MIELVKQYKKYLKKVFCLDLSKEHLQIDITQLKMAVNIMEQSGLDEKRFWSIAFFGYCYREGLNWKDVFSQNGISGCQFKLYLEDRLKLEVKGKVNMKEVKNIKEGESMKKPIEQVLPNPHRDFEIYSIDKAQVKLLIDSIKDVGMFLGLPARKTSAGYEIACGHHRLEALKEIGITHVDLAVNDYSDEDMLKIMIRENATQRGHENFGAVLDSVGAVLVSCVKDIYCNNVGASCPDMTKSQEIVKGQVESGEGIGRRVILAKEPSFPERHVKTALKTFKSTNTYLKLFKKGGLPEEFWPLYDQVAITTIEAVAKLPKPSHAKEWIDGVKNELFQNKVNQESHVDIVERLIDKKENIPIKAVKARINSLIDANIGDKDPNKEEKAEKTLSDETNQIVSKIKSFKRQLAKFLDLKGDKVIHTEDMNSIIDTIQNDLERFRSIRAEYKSTITIEDSVTFEDKKQAIDI